MSPLLMLTATLVWPPSLPAYEAQFFLMEKFAETAVDVGAVPRDADAFAVIGYAEGSVDSLSTIAVVGVEHDAMPWEPRLGLPWKISPENRQLYEDLSDSFCSPEVWGVLWDPLACQYYSWYYAAAADACVGKANPQPVPRGSIPQQNFIDSGSGAVLVSASQPEVVAPRRTSEIVP